MCCLLGVMTDFRCGAAVVVVVGTAAIVVSTGSNDVGGFMCVCSTVVVVFLICPELVFSPQAERMRKSTVTSRMIGKMRRG